MCTRLPLLLKARHQPPCSRHMIRGDLTWMVSTCGVEITSGLLIDSLPPTLDTVHRVKSLLLRLNCSHVCSGNPDGKFHELQSEQPFVKSSSQFQ